MVVQAFRLFFKDSGDPGAGVWLRCWVVATVLMFFSGFQSPVKGEEDFLKGPGLQQAYDAVMYQLELAFQERDYSLAGELIAQLDGFTRSDPAIDFHRARLMAATGEKESVLATLNDSVSGGFCQDQRIVKEELFDEWRKEAAFLRLVREAASEVRPHPEAPEEVEILAVDRVAELGEEHLYWSFADRVFRNSFKMMEIEPVSWSDEIDKSARELLDRWGKQGRLAGSSFEIYDNHDLGHSDLSKTKFPGLRRIVYRPELREQGLAHGLQLRFLHDAVVVGNSSMASVGNIFWRSQPRLAYANPSMAARLQAQYRNNHLYVYPEHHDYDPGHNGKAAKGEEAGGFGDVYPAMTPYLLISQGSSGSDQPILEALFLTLAAFKPEVKEYLIDHGILMPTLQMIFRWCYGGATAENYLTGEAHPPVFDGSLLDVESMMRKAQSMTRDSLPPLVKLNVLGEDRQSIFGNERLMDTNQAIARVFRSPLYARTMIVSAARSVDLEGAPLSFKWVILRGDESRIWIRPLNESGSVAEVVVAWHERFPVSPGSEMETNRVDLGVFADNGKCLSAPAFITTYFLDNEKRTYGQSQRLLTLDYTDTEKKGNYVDPMVEPQKGWRDDFIYDAEGNLSGWKRSHEGLVQRYTAQGRLITEMDGKGMPTQTKAVTYHLIQDPDQKQLPRVVTKVE
ncbi:MAG: hypothetical protein P1U68_07215 [Verrucomicrobiales bacterium]|nr:hypothetical protein [Verrucomicrobiales bacterium]